MQINIRFFFYFMLDVTHKYIISIQLIKHHNAWLADTTDNKSFNVQK